MSKKSELQRNTGKTTRAIHRVISDFLEEKELDTVYYVSDQIGARAYARRIMCEVLKSYGFDVTGGRDMLTWTGKWNGAYNGVKTVKFISYDEWDRMCERVHCSQFGSSVRKFVLD